MADQLSKHFSRTRQALLHLLLVCAAATVAQAQITPGRPATPATPGAPSGVTSQSQSGVVVQTQGGAQGSGQGRQFGQPGFVGEPISVNVVDADIRDILNYITEQYGINFVIDASVGAVPVTLNVTDVPWNQALEAVLKANRLGIDVSGNILRLATIQVLATEAAAQERIRDAQLNNAPLVTEIIPLNYARASGTLAQAAGSTGSFAGGNAVGSFSGGVGGDLTGQSGDSGILPIIARRLSRRGSVEVDGRGNRLIVTDVRDNIEAVRRLIDLLDQPEPQVEIETRIVIASRNFTRDLGVQLGAVVLNPSRGSAASFATMPVTVNPPIQGVPGPVPSLAATGASTVIGLTTGLIGTAQINAAITAAETKGQVKTIATPRITALNNRTAQVETGSQIPVVTPQQNGGGGTGGGLLLTTSFVSVPLRLSVTPQISNADTVILRVVAENNSINTTIAAAGGTPGIDSQRMQTEVLVPDGGTTVVGGAIQDVESNRQDRTPGLSGIPVLGNLFKRRLVRRDTAELLFFITPRIYRPDFQGRPLPPGSAQNPRRRGIIDQPVPLGNPTSNTPVPQPNQQLLGFPQTQLGVPYGGLTAQPGGAVPQQQTVTPQAPAPAAPTP